MQMGYSVVVRNYTCRLCLKFLKVLPLVHFLYTVLMRNLLTECAAGLLCPFITTADCVCTSVR